MNEVNKIVNDPTRAPATGSSLASRGEDTATASAPRLFEPSAPLALPTGGAESAAASGGLESLDSLEYLVRSLMTSLPPGDPGSDYYKAFIGGRNAAYENVLIMLSVLKAKESSDSKKRGSNISSQRTRPPMPAHQQTEAPTQEQRPGSL